MEPVRVAIVSEDPLARGGMAALLHGRADVAVAAAASAAEAGGATAGARADVVLWDAAGDAEAAEELGTALPVVALVSDDAAASRALEAGARGVLLRDADADRIAAALAAAARGLVVVDAALARSLRGGRATRGGAGGERLTAREGEVLALLAEGLSNKAIAARLGIAERTAKFHVESILGKLGAESRSEAIVLAARRGLVAL